MKKIIILFTIFWMDFAIAKSIVSNSPYKVSENNIKRKNCYLSVSENFINDLKLFFTRNGGELIYFDKYSPFYLNSGRYNYGYFVYTIKNELFDWGYIKHGVNDQSDLSVLVEDNTNKDAIMRRFESSKFTFDLYENNKYKKIYIYRGRCK